MKTKRVRLLQWELAEEQLAIAMGRRRVTTAGHRASDQVHLAPLDQQIGIDARPRSRIVVETVRESRSFQQQGVDAFGREHVQDRDRAPSGAAIPSRLALGMSLARASRMSRGQSQASGSPRSRSYVRPVKSRSPHARRNSSDVIRNALRAMASPLNSAAKTSSGRLRRNRAGHCVSGWSAP